MKDNIIIQPLWYDDDLMQVEIKCSSESIFVDTKIYVTDALVDELIDTIKHFLHTQEADVYWANEEKGDKATACVSLCFIPKDKLGHILIEVYIEIDDGGKYSDHNCCFYVNTEIGLLENFQKKLVVLKERLPGAIIELNP